MNNNRKIIITCLVLALVICLVLSLAAIFGASFFIVRSESTPAEEQIQEPLPTQTSDIESPPANEDSSIKPEVAIQMELIQRQVIEMRGLDPNGEFTRSLFTPEQLKQRVLDDFLEDYTPEDAQIDTMVLAVFGLVEPGFDFHTFYIDLLSEQIAGFYDNETKEMVVVQGEGFGGPERLTYAHEYTHALQDQNYDIENGLNYNDDACEQDSERCAAIQALLEGDASLSELNWFFEHATTEDKTDIFDFYDSYESPVLDSAPAFMEKDFLFPYENGLEFVQYLYDQGGWGAVDEVYANLPTSTEQILHPERYPEDQPIPVNSPDFSSLLGDGWEEVDSGVMGEWYLYLILSQGSDAPARINEEDAADAAEGWGGDSYVVYHNPGENTSAMAITVLWESGREAREYAVSFEDYGVGRFGQPAETDPDFWGWNSGDGYHIFAVSDEVTTWIFAPTSDLAHQIWETLSK